MSNKQFKVMVVPRWFTTTPETVKALAYVYDYHVRDMPSFLNPNSLNINEALRTKFRLEGIVQAHTTLDKTNWDYLQMDKKLANPNPVGYFTGWVSMDTASDGSDFGVTTVTDSITKQEFLVGGIKLKDQKDYIPMDIEIPFSACEQNNAEVSLYAQQLIEKLFPESKPKPVMHKGKVVGTITIDGKVDITDPEFKQVIGASVENCFSVRSYNPPTDFPDGQGGINIWSLPLPKVNPDQICEALSNEIKWDNRELGADPSFATVV